jgi:hypothetical protein
VNPGLHHDLDETTYHADEALSASGAKKLLPPSCPALYRWERDHGQPQKAAFDLGKAAHAGVLGVGADIVVVDAANWTTKAAKEQRDNAYAEGRTPILIAEKVRVDAMAAALRQHPLASALLDPDHGRPEVSAFWTDERHGVNRRCRFDWLPDTDGGRLLVADFKSTSCAEPGAFARSVFNYSYDLQAAFYLDGIRALELAEDAVFLFVAQETTAPYLITVFELDGDALRIGQEKTQRALSTFAECQATGEWPGYSTDIELISPPGYIARQYEGVL